MNKTNDPPPDLTQVVDFIVNGAQASGNTPDTNPLQYGDLLTSAQLSKLNIPSADPAATINGFLSDKTAIINDPSSTDGGYNCIMYDNVKGLVNSYLKDPTICSQHIESKCTLSAFTDASNIGVSASNEKSFGDYNTFISSSGLNLKKEYVSCGDRTNILMWVYKDAASTNTKPDAVGVPVNQCPALSLNLEDLSSSTTSINAICNQPQSYALVFDDILKAGYKCKTLPPTSAAGGAAAAGAVAAGAVGGTAAINPFKCNNL